MPRQNRTIPLDWDRRAVRILAQIAPPDPDIARIWWEQFAPDAYKALMDSKLIDQIGDVNDEEELARLLSEVLLDNDSQRHWYAAGLLLFFIGGYYWRATGRRVAWSLIRSVLNRTIQSGGFSMNGLCEQLRDGSISLQNWQAQMVTMIKASHLAGAMLAAGGSGGLTPEVLAIVENKVEEQLSYLGEFAGRIADGLPLDGNLCRVMRMYLSGARGVFFAVEADRMLSNGFTEYINILGPTEDHCTGGGSCLEVSDQGWQPVGTLPEVGTRLCLSNCLCHWQYRRFDGFDADGNAVYTII